MSNNILDSNNNSSTLPDDPRGDMPLIVSMLFLFFTVAVSAMIGLGLIALLGYLLGYEVSELVGRIGDNSSATDRNFLRSTILINHVTMFIIPGIVFGIYLHGKSWWSYFNLNINPKVINIISGVFLLLLSMPLVQFLFWINKNWIPLPEWARSMEAETANAISSLLLTDTSFEFLFNVLIIAVVPAIGEELIFRGIIQKQFEKHFNSAIVAIWLAAFIFSAFHFQFEGFLPRFVLGALLGYLYYWSGNLWVPIIAHFMNNFLQILAQYLFQNEMSDIDLESVEMSPIWQWLPSLVLVFTVAHFIRAYNKDLKHKTDNIINTKV
jgi:membrane protease YdiL (CAAX protease family)